MMSNMVKQRLVLLAALAILALVLCGCTTTKFVPVESGRTEHIKADTTHLVRLIDLLREQVRSKDRAIDSLMQSYRELLVLNDNGDTLRHDRERVVYRSSHREKELERLLESKSDLVRELRQQLEHAKSDSIPVPYPVEKQLTRWEKTKMDFGGFALGGLAIGLSIVVLWLIRKFKG